MSRHLPRVIASPCVVTIGAFDGVHHGHRALVASTRAYAEELGMETVAITFSPRPDQLFAPEKALPDICSINERCRRLREAGADRVIVVPFNRDVAAIGYREFVRYLVVDVGMVALWVGQDFAFGRGREGTPESLRQLGVQVFEHTLVPNAAGTAKASSTSVRNAISDGQEPRAALRAA